jgi:hypothetical protein
MLRISFHARFLSLTMIHFYHTLARMILLVCPRHKFPINLKSPGTLPYVRPGKKQNGVGWISHCGKKSYKKRCSHCWLFLRGHVMGQILWTLFDTVFDIFYCVMYISPHNSSFTAKLDYCPFEFLHKDVENIGNLVNYTREVTPTLALPPSLIIFSTILGVTPYLYHHFMMGQEMDVRKDIVKTLSLTLIADGESRTNHLRSAHAGAILHGMCTTFSLCEWFVLLIVYETLWMKNKYQWCAS